MWYIACMERAHTPFWHRPERVKGCIRCGAQKSLGEFYAYYYTTRQGKPGTRYESRCKQCSRERRVERSRANPGMDAAYSAKGRLANPGRAAAYAKVKQAEPAVKAMKAFHQRLRKARMRAKATDGPEIRAIYAEAMRIEALIQCCPVFDLPELGKKMHVDHIIPLSRGGQHVPSNLQILPGGLNMRKGVKCLKSLPQGI